MRPTRFQVALAAVGGLVVGVATYGRSTAGDEKDAKDRAAARELMLRSGADRTVREYVFESSRFEPEMKDNLDPLLDAVADEVRSTLTREEMAVAQKAFGGTEGETLKKVLAVIEQKSREVLARKDRRGAPDPVGEAEAQREVMAMSHLRSLHGTEVGWMNSAWINADGNEFGEAASGLEIFGSTVFGRTKAEARPGESLGTALGDAAKEMVPKDSRWVYGARAEVDDAGGAVVDGYVFWVYLPDTSSTRPGWVRSARDGTKAVLVGGTGRIDVKAAETVWCAYAVPLEYGKTGRSTFVIDGDGGMYFANNNHAKHEGRSPIDPWSAYTKDKNRTILAIGTSGCDGELWRVTGR